MKTDDWSAAVRELRADRRAEIGERAPELETLQAFFRAELPEAEAEVVREFLLLYPEVAAALSRDEEAPPVVGPGHPAHLSAAEREAGWNDLVTRLNLADAGEVAAHPPAPPTRFAPRWHTLWAIAATLAVAALGLATLVPDSPRVLLTQKVESDHTRGGLAPPWPVQLRTSDDEVFLDLLLPSSDSQKRYRLELHAERDEATKLLWQADDVPPGANQTIALRVPRSWIPPGIYQWHLQAEGEGGDATRWVYRFETTGGE